MVYLVFNEGYLATAGDEPARADLTAEAIRLGRLLHDLMPDEPEVTGLLALMLLTEARRASRFAGGELVPLPRAGPRRLGPRADRRGPRPGARVPGAATGPGHYQLMAAVNAVHTDAPTAADTDWSQVAALYAQLEAVAPSPLVTLNRAVAVAELDGPAVALATVDRLVADTPVLASYHALHATRADLLRRLGRSAEARDAYDAAIAATGNEAERAYLTRRRSTLVV